MPMTPNSASHVWTVRNQKVAECAKVLIGTALWRAIALVSLNCHVPKIRCAMNETKKNAPKAREREWR